MKFIFSLIAMLSLSTFVWAAEEKTSSYNYEPSKCSGEEDTFIRGLEEELANCKGDFDVLSTDELLKAYDSQNNCVVAVAYKLFDRFYIKNNKEVKEHFNDMVRAIGNYYNDINLSSDFATENHLAAAYTEAAAAETAAQIRKAVEQYIHSLKREREEKA